jgi:hypothetical protein
LAKSDQDINIQIKRVTVAAAAVAGAIAVIEGPGNFDLWSTMAGIVLLMILQVFVLQADGNTDIEPLPNPYERAIFNAVWALCFLVAIGFIIDIISNLLTTLLGILINNTQTSANPLPDGTANTINNFLNIVLNIFSNVFAFAIWIFIARKREAITSNRIYLSLFHVLAKINEESVSPSSKAVPSSNKTKKRRKPVSTSVPPSTINTQQAATSTISTPPISSHHQQNATDK